MVWNLSALSAIFAREAAVVAEETGSRGFELLNGGDTLGGGAMILARSDELFSPDAVAA